MKRGYVIVNGNLSQIPSLRKKMSPKDLLICADGAAEHAFKQQLIPHVIIGDLDSIPKKTANFYRKKNVEFIHYPREKDYTDGELAIEYAIKKGVTELVICGLLGDRVDHILSNVFYVAQIAKKVPCMFMEGSSNLYIIHNFITLHGSKGDELSLIPLKDCKGVTTVGLYYPLDKAVLHFGTTRGISNVFLNKRISVSIERGMLCVLHRKQ